MSLEQIAQRSYEIGQRQQFHTGSIGQAGSGRRRLYMLGPRNDVYALEDGQISGPEMVGIDAGGPISAIRRGGKAVMDYNGDIHWIMGTTEPPRRLLSRCMGRSNRTQRYGTAAYQQTPRTIEADSPRE